MVESAENPKAIENHQNQPSKSSIIAAAVEALIMASLSVLLAWLEDSAGRFPKKKIVFSIFVPESFVFLTPNRGCGCFLDLLVNPKVCWELLLYPNPGQNHVLTGNAFRTSGGFSLLS